MTLTDDEFFKATKSLEFMRGFMFAHAGQNEWQFSLAYNVDIVEKTLKLNYTEREMELIDEYNIKVDIIDDLKDKLVSKDAEIKNLKCLMHMQDMPPESKAGGWWRRSRK
jgi:hypothetical protein